MSTDSAEAREKQRRDAWFSFLILAVFAAFFFGMALALGTEPRMRVERVGEQKFRVTGSNHFFGVQFFSRTLHEVEGVHLASRARNDRRDSIEERNRRAAQKSLDFTDPEGWSLSWGRIDDSRLIDEFMRGKEASLELRDPPPWWRAALSWAALAFGGLIFIAALKSFLPKKPGPMPWS